MGKQVYEISLWKDKLSDDGSYLQEKKLAVIGSNTMTTNCRAVEPKLTSNVNGTNTFTFKMYYKYVDNRTGEKFDNPFLGLLTNERRVKVYWPQSGVDKEWYDLVIKKCDEDSSGKSITYTCEDLYITELSKNGFNIELDDELQNNQGTAYELGARIVDETNWKVISPNGKVLAVDTEGNVYETSEKVDYASDYIVQQQQEAVYEATLINSVTAKKINIGSSSSSVKINTGSKILVYYSQVPSESGNATISFLYADSYTTDSNSQLVSNGDYYELDGNWVIDDPIYGTIFRISETNIFILGKTPTVSKNYRAKRYVNSNVSVYDSLSEHYCTVYDAAYSDGNHEIYKYQAAKTNEATIVTDLMINGSDFSDTDGWTADGISLTLYPAYTEETELSTYDPKGYIKLPTNDWAYNSALQSYSSFLSDGIQVGESFIIRIKAMTEEKSAPSGTYCGDSNIISPLIKTYKMDGELYIPDDEGIQYADVSENKYNSETGYYEYKIVINTSATRSDLYNKKIGLFIKPLSNIWIENIEFFKLVKDSDGNIIYPDTIVTDNVVATYYYYYDHTKYKDETDISNVNFLYCGIEDVQPTKDGSQSITLVPRKNDYLKVRSISAKESNRFNLLQDIAETFQCWVRFVINHDENGKILRDSDGTPQKYIIFLNEIGENKGIVFRYGTDLSKISRSIESSELVTKTIVAVNNNEYAENGFCTIARSEQNYSKENFILNFDYFVSNGLIDNDQLYYDLWSPLRGEQVLCTNIPYGEKVPSDYTFYQNINSSWEKVAAGSTFTEGVTYAVTKEDFDIPYVKETRLGYYYWLNHYNTIYDNITTSLTSLSTDITQQEARLKVAQEQYNAAAEQISNLKTQMLESMNLSDWNDETIKKIEARVSEKEKDDKVVTLYTSYRYQNSQVETYKKSIEILQSSVTGLYESKDSYNTKQLAAKEKLSLLHKVFNSKYGNYIQEGSWNSDDYIDDTLYYLDALDIAYTSSRPKISYSLDVLRVSSLDEFKGKTFGVGDICAVEDTEFFGYLDDGITPYKEKVLISEITYVFDQPDQDRITIQNYKTQFEDLFQRIAASTQSLSYSEGSYARAAAAVTSNGTIDETVLQNSFTSNESLVQSFQNETFQIDATGISLTDVTNSLNKIKIASGGIFITTDGGVTWKSAVKSTGISTSYLTAGMINVNDINIYNGSHKTFKWDGLGINAYTTDEGGGTNEGHFVRFDQYGIYGINGDSRFNPENYAVKSYTDAETYIWDTANFALTWKGFSLRSVSGNNKLTISSDNDICLFEDEITRLKIGRIQKSGSEDIYGITINDSGGNSVIYTNSNGNLYLDNTLYILSGETSSEMIRIGHFSDTINNESTSEIITTSEDSNDSSNTDDTDADTRYQIINAKDNFIVYDDGSIIANNGTFTGVINATSGTFKGEIIASSGTFSGEINASSGKIGPLQISDDALICYNTDTSSYSITEKGISLTNMEFSIRSTDESGKISDTKGSLSYDTSNGLQITGNIKANTLEVGSGTIGGFTISENDLSTSNGSLILNGTEGYIIADTITLGTGATIDDYLKIGDSYIYNPTKHEGLFLSVKGKSEENIESNKHILRVYNNGEIYFGRIYLDGNESIIRGGDSTTSNFFSITPEQAIFKNVEVSGKIQSAIFEVGRVQSVGGIMLFKPSYKISSIYSTGCELESEFTGEAGDYIYLIDADGQLSQKLYQIGAIDKNTKTKLTFTEEDTDSNFNNIIGIVDLGSVSDTEDSSKQGNTLMMGVNSTSVYSNLMKPRGISISEWYIENNDVKTTTKVFLGDLNQLAVSNITGYGLYSENVYLKGSLLTEYQSDKEDTTYAGISTTNDISSNKISGDTSRVIFWGGADSLENVGNAPFQVTEKGSIYASQGIFKGAIFTEGSIQGSQIYSSDIYGAKLHGWEGGPSPDGYAAALSIYGTKDSNNSTRGISFIEVEGDDSNKEVETFSISSTGLIRKFSDSKNSLTFISLGDTVDFNGNSYSTYNETNYLKISEATITNYYNSNASGSISFETNDTTNERQISIKMTESSNISIDSNSCDITTITTAISQNMTLGDKMQYKKVDGGYDLYIVS